MSREPEDRYAELLAQADLLGDAPDIDRVTWLRWQLEDLGDEVRRTIPDGSERHYELRKLHRQVDRKLTDGSDRTRIAGNVTAAKLKREKHAAEHPTQLDQPKPDRRRGR
ncbi:hypothetical protein ACFVMC_26580 [Nocardia sp. NPDC127579]|uniref:hypothetical protein n=1 Tax=Nocardia sp. NPDC127579 TaxID=3345402 RepID=UPI00362C7174